MQAPKPNLRTSKIFSPPKFLKIRDIKLGLFAFSMMAICSGNSDAADTVKGGQLYAMHCASCHGSKGTGVMPNAPDFSRNEGLLQPDLSLLAVIKSGMNAMPAYQGVLSDQDILDVIVYLRTLN